MPKHYQGGLIAAPSYVAWKLSRNGTWEAAASDDSRQELVRLLESRFGPEHKCIIRRMGEAPTLANATVP